MRDPIILLVHLIATLARLMGDFLLRATRDRNAAIAFFRKTVGASHTTPPRGVNVDKNPAYPIAFEAIKHEGFFRPRSSLRQCKYLNNVIEQDHRFIKRRTRPRRCCTNRHGPARCPPTGSSPADSI